MHSTRLLSQIDGRFMITDGGLETDLIFHHGIDLPHFASYPLLGEEAGLDSLRAYFDQYASIARAHSAGFLLEAPTWRANPDWAPLLGHSLERQDAFNREAIVFLHELAAGYAPQIDTTVVSGCIGPRGDGYVVGQAMTADEAREYHSRQVGVFAEAGADLVSAFTMNYVEEAIGIVDAATQVGIPVVISFTVETDGRLPSGQSLGAAIEQTDNATDGAPAYYMVNCAHPTHFDGVLDGEARWAERIVGVRANASTLSHAELDEAEELDDGDPVDFGARNADLRSALPNLAVVGGCCGTDHRHVAEVAKAWIAA